MRLRQYCNDISSISRANPANCGRYTGRYPAGTHRDLGNLSDSSEGITREVIAGPRPGRHTGFIVNHRGDHHAGGSSRA